jgi:hypothetical protein
MAGYLETHLSFNSSIAFKNVSLPLADVLGIYGNETKGEHTLPNGTIAGGHLAYGAVEFILEWCVQEFATEVINGIAKTSC